jgi:hypothetical protein
MQIYLAGSIASYGFWLEYRFDGSPTENATIFDTKVDDFLVVAITAHSNLCSACMHAQLGFAAFDDVYERVRTVRS